MAQVNPETTIIDTLLETTWDQVQLSSDIDGVLNDGAFTKIITGKFNSVEVAVKMTQEGTTPEQKCSLLQEIVVMKRIRSVCGGHPNIVLILGQITQQDPHPVLIMELCPEGSLLNYLHVNLKGERQGHLSCIIELLLSYAKQICSGMAHLSCNKLIHRDLAARHVLVYDRNMVKITHFGATCHCYEEACNSDIADQLSDSSHIRSKWMAPEVLSRQQFSIASDVWAFGVVLWELFSFGASPYCLMSTAGLLDRLQNGFRLEQPADCPQYLYDVMNLCWQHDPTNRPSFPQLQHELQHFHPDILI